MNTKLILNMVSLFSVIFFEGNIMLEHSCFSEERSLKSQVICKEPTNDFKQLTNQEIFKVGFDRLSTVENLPPFSEFFEKRSKNRQVNYNIHLKALIIGYTKSHNDEAEDLKYMEWVAETNKITYKRGEPIGIRIFLRNISGKEVLVQNNILPSSFLLNSIDLKKIERQEKQKVFLTQFGYRQYIEGVHNEFSERSLGYSHLQPGEKVLIDQESQRIGTLNLFYDLSEQGEYELTFYTRNYIGDNQIAEFPKSSQTIRFKIEPNSSSRDWLDKQVKW